MQRRSDRGRREWGIALVVVLVLVGIAAFALRSKGPRTSPSETAVAEEERPYEDAVPDPEPPKRSEIPPAQEPTELEEPTAQPPTPTVDESTTPWSVLALRVVSEESGLGLEGVNCSIEPAAGGRHGAPAISDANGNLRAEDCPAGELMLRTTWRGAEVEYGPVRAGDTAPPLVLAERGSLHVQVIDSTGSGVPDATVEVRRWEGWSSEASTTFDQYSEYQQNRDPLETWVRGTTDSFGVVILPGIGTGKLGAHATRGARSSEWIAASHVAGAQEEVRLTLQDAIWLSGRVIDSFGLALSDATVQVSSSEIPVDTSGRFRVEFPLGRSWVDFEADHHASLQKRVNTKDRVAGSELDLGDVVLEPAMPVTIRVADLEGNPLAGAEVKWLAWVGAPGDMFLPREHDLTDENGRSCFERASPGARVDCTVSLDGYCEENGQWQADPEEDVLVTLVPEAVLALRIEPAAGVDSSGTVARLFEARDPEDLEAPGHSQRDLMGRLGNFDGTVLSFRNLRPGPVFLILEGPGIARAAHSFELHPGANEEVILLEAAAPIRGTLRFPDGRVAANASVAVTLSGLPQGFQGLDTRVTESGEFFLDSVPSNRGAIRLQAHVKDAEGSWFVARRDNVAPGSTLELTLEPDLEGPSRFGRPPNPSGGSRESSERDSR